MSQSSLPLLIVLSAVACGWRRRAGRKYALAAGALLALLAVTLGQTTAPTPPFAATPTVVGYEYPGAGSVVFSMTTPASPPGVGPAAQFPTLADFTGDGTGGFQLAFTYVTSYGPSSPILTDFNGGGNLDTIQGFGDTRGNLRNRSGRLNLPT